MKKTTNILLIILLIAILYLLFLSINNIRLKTEINDLKAQIQNKETYKKIFDKKEDELIQIQTENEEKIEKFNEVERWNQEIVKYLKQQ